MKLYIENRTSKKTNKSYLALVAETECGETIVSFDTMVLLKVSGMPLTALYALKSGEKVEIH